MGKLSDKEKYDILCKQEEELRFEHFDNDDAWKLGKILVKKAKEDKLPIAIDIQIRFLGMGLQEPTDLMRSGFRERSIL